MISSLTKKMISYNDHIKKMQNMKISNVKNSTKFYCSFNIKFKTFTVKPIIRPLESYYVYPKSQIIPTR
jgi:hypothetical protein